MRPVWLTARVARADGVEVCVALDADRTEFVEAGQERPEGLHLELGEAVLRTDAEAHLEKDSAPPPVTLADLLLALHPGGAHEALERLGEVAAVDNRLDLEAELLALRACIARLRDEWRSEDAGFVAMREKILARRDPTMAEVLVRWPERRAGADLGRWSAWLDADTATHPPVVADASHWEAWSARDEEDLLGDHGGLARLLGEGFEARAGQLDMALTVRRALEKNEHLMCEAGTGIGKSLAYLVPALLHAARTEGRVVVSTHTRALQSQLVENDLPLLRRLGYPGTPRLLLGRNNYLCRRQIRRALQAMPADAEAARAQFALAVWTLRSSEGRREELMEHPWYHRFWRTHFDSVEPCSPHICHRDPVCFVVRARRLAREAQVVVVNHSLLMMDLRSGQSLIGPADVLIVDEAHQLADVATHAYSLRLYPERLEVHRNLCGERARPGELREVLAHLARVEGEKVERAAQQADAALDRFIASFEQWFDALAASVRERFAEAAQRAGSYRIHDGDETFGPVALDSERVLADAEAFEQALAILLGRSGDSESEQVAEEREGLASLLEAHRDLREQIAFCLRADDEDWVYWLEWAGERGLRAVVAAPLTLEEPLARHWDEDFSSVVMTSATLAVENDFLPFAESIGFSQVQRFTETLQIESPFRAEEQALLLTALNLPAPDDAHFVDAVADVVAGVAGAVATKTLVLSTSYRFLDQLEPLLRARLGLTGDELFERSKVEGLEVLVQHPGVSRDALADRFRRARAAVLLATGSFWEGIDFPGQQLEVLVVPRLPFPVPTDPVVEGRSERARRRGRDPFADVSLVDAVLRLKQGVGRLLRSHDDRGAVLLLDQRLQTRAYGVRFLNSMPRLCEIVPTVEEIAPRAVEFLQKAHRERSGRA